MKNKITKLVIMMIILASAVNAGEFRSFVPVANQQAIKESWSDSSVVSTAAGKTPGISQTDLDKIAREARNRASELARTGLNNMFEAWNSGQIEKFLSPRFYDVNRFLDAMLTDVPRDARVRLMAIESIQPIEQVNQLVDALTGQPTANTIASDLQLLVKTKISAVVRTQVEFNDLNNGFQKREGRNEFILELSQKIPLIFEKGR